MQNKKNYLKIIGYFICIIYGLFTFNYIYNHNEYFENALPKVMITSAIFFSIFLILTFILLKFLLKQPKWEKSFTSITITSFLSFTFYALYRIFSNSSSLKIMFSFGLEFVIVSLVPAIFLYSMLLCIGSFIKND